MKPIIFASLILIQSSVVSNNGALAASAEGATSLKLAVAAYNKGDFSACVSTLDNACRGSLATDAQAHYYLANALVKLSRHNEAQNHYEQARRLAPNTPLAQYASSAIATLNASAQLASGAPSSSTSSSPNSSPSSSRLSAAEYAKQQRAAQKLEETKKRQQEEALYPINDNPNFDPRSIDSSLVQVKRRTNDNNFVLWQVQTALNLVPSSVKEDLKAFGVTVLVTPTTLEANPELASEKANGDTFGRSYSNALAMYDGADKVIYIPERVSLLSSVPERNKEVCASMLHEMGHAFDHCNNFISQRSGYISIYSNDVQRLTNTQKNRFPYYTQGAGTGESEAFAELFSFVMDPRLLTIKYNRDLANAFPLTFNYIKSVAK